MSKLKFIITFCAASLLFFSCGNLSDFIKPAKVITPENYTEASGRVDISKMADSGESDIFMFVLNTSDETVLPEDYKDIFNAGSSRSAVNGTSSTPVAAVPPSFEEFDHVPKSVREAYSLRPESSSSRAAEDYERSKNKKAAEVGDTRRFCYFYEDADESESIKVSSATCRYVNDVCQIFVQDGCFLDDDDLTESYSGTGLNIKVTPAGAAKLGENFKKICGAEEKLLGPANPGAYGYNNVIETPERITIFLSDIGRQASSMTIGYFYPSDLFCDRGSIVLNPDTDEYEFERNPEIASSSKFYSNEATMFTLNILAYDPAFGENKMLVTLGHEFNHMLNFINKALPYKDGKHTTWFTEMLSAVSEYYTPALMDFSESDAKKTYGTKLSYFNFGPYYGMLNWSGSDSDPKNVMYSYGFAHVFGMYLVKNYGGTKLIHSLATNHYYEKEAVTQALRSCGYNESFDSVLKKFALVMTNLDGKDKTSPTLNKSLEENYGGYTFKFAELDLCDYNSVCTGGVDMNDYDSPFWTSGAAEKGPCFFAKGKYPEKIMSNSLYGVYLGKKKEYDNILTFNPSDNESVKAYIYVQN